MFNNNYPRWERGYRGHGYWINAHQAIAEVTISPPFDKSPDRYGWHLIISNYPSTIHKGRCKTLKEAKQSALLDSFQKRLGCTFAYSFPRGREQP
jgi:hypothetical protein